MNGGTRFTHDDLVMRCATCGKEKPNDASWPRPATCCGASSWTSSVTLTETPEGIVAHGDVRYGIEVPRA
jgi:hypothetical protein